jgi:hypothetical protein
MSRCLFALALLLATRAVVAGPPPCPQYAPHAVLTGHVPAALPELSGFAASRVHPGIFWAHNDSGNVLAIYAMRADGTIAATVPLRGVTARDPEDIAVGPCGPGSPRSCIYLADIGDNGSRRQSVQILKMVEPERLDAAPLIPTILPFRYAGGPRNAEALIVDPVSARVFVITKNVLSLGDVFRVDGLGGRQGGTAVRIRTLRAPREYDAATTAASAHPSGERLLIRTYTRVWELRSPGARSFEDVLDAEPVFAPAAHQPQGEAISYTFDGRDYLLGGEGVDSPIFRVSCAEK